MSNSTIAGKLKGLEERFESEVRNRRENASCNSPVGLGTPRPGSGRRPKPLFSGREIPAFPPRSPHNVETENRMKEVYKVSGKLNVNGTEYRSHIDELQHLGELGSGTCGHVVKMLHKPSAAVIAVKQMRRSGNSEETKRILMDLDVVVRSHDCRYIVRCLGCFVTDADVWICMELMATCFDKLLKRLGAPIPEAILGKVTMATVNALSYLKDAHGVIHRDVKPSNILLDERGNVKLCDFGISGRLVDSKAKTRSAGCAAYMAPERIDPPDPSRPDYDIRADVWSLGISLVELATGVFPYRDCQNDFEVLTRVIEEDPPKLPDTDEFTSEFKSFVSQCLTKNYRQRPKYAKLLEHPFVVKATKSSVSVGDWYATLPMPGQSTPTKPVIRTVATFNVTNGSSGNGSAYECNGGIFANGSVFGAETFGTNGGVSSDNVAETSSGRFVTDAQHWIDQVTPQPQRAWWALGGAGGRAGAGAGAGGSRSQPSSLEPDLAASPTPLQRNMDGCLSPPTPVRRFSIENRWRPSPTSSGNTSPIVLQRFHHQSQQRRSRADTHAAPRHRSLSREHSTGRSPEPPPRSCRLKRPPLADTQVGVSSEYSLPPPLHERLHPPSPLLLSHNRVLEGRSQSVSRVEPPVAAAAAAAAAATASPKLSHDDQGWLHSLAGLVKRRLSGYVKWQHHAQRPNKPPPTGKSRWGTSESWSVPASPLPPRSPRPD